MTKLTSIVVGVDGRPGGWDGLALARRLARLDGGRLTVVCAHPALGFEHAALVWGAICDESDARRVIDEARERLAGADAELLAVAGAMPATCLGDVARERAADLLVLGGPEHGLLGRALGASVLSGALVDPPCPVAVAPRGTATGIARLHRVGIAVDGSPAALAALRWARELAAAHGEIRELELIAIEPHAGAGAPIAGDELLTHAAAPRFDGQSQPAVRWAARSGGAPHELAELSVRLDLLVIGTHGRGGVSRLLHGSLSRAVAQRARCPVVVVPASPA